MLGKAKNGRFSNRLEICLLLGRDQKPGVQALYLCNCQKGGPKAWNKKKKAIILPVLCFEVLLHDWKPCPFGQVSDTWLCVSQQGLLIWSTTDLIKFGEIRNNTQWSKFKSSKLQPWLKSWIIDLFLTLGHFSHSPKRSPETQRKKILK